MDDLISESRLSAEKFKKLSSSDQKEYLKRYPKSKHRQLIGSKPKPKAEKKKSIKKKGKSSPAPKVEKKKKKKKSKEKAKTPKQVQVEVNKDNAQEKRLEIKKAENKPLISNSIDRGTDLIAREPDKVANAVDNRVTPHLKKALGAVFGKISAGLKASDEEKEPIKKASSPIMKIALGAGALALLGPMAIPAVAIMAGKYMETFDFEGLSEKMNSESSSQEIDPEDDPLGFMVRDVSRFMAKVDQDMLSERFSEMAALEQMGEDDDEDHIEDALEDDDELTSESALSKRLSFQLVRSQKRLAPNLRTRWDIRYGEDLIGQIQADPKIPGNGHEKRCWVVTLEDGFDESAFDSGFSNLKPFTIVNKGRLLLRNPQRLTMPEARLWAKHTINRSYL